MEVVGSVWPFLSKNAIFRNPSKKMRLDESFRMVQVPRRNSASIKSYGQITVIIKTKKIGPVKNVKNKSDPTMVDGSIVKFYIIFWGYLRHPQGGRICNHLTSMHC